MEKQFKMTGHFEDMDEFEFESLKEEHGGEWTIEGSGAKWEAGVKTLNEVVATFGSWGEEFEDVDELEVLALSELVEIDRGWTATYEFERVA